jgi:hypothetical protein
MAMGGGMPAIDALSIRTTVVLAHEGVSSAEAACSMGRRNQDAFMVWQPLTLHGLATLLADQDRELEPTLKSRLSRFRCNPSTIPCVRGGRPDQDSMWVLARARERVLLYDSVEEEFGTGVVDRDGMVRDWGTFGYKLKWSVARFLADPSHEPVEQPAQAAWAPEAGGGSEPASARRSMAGALGSPRGIRAEMETGKSSVVVSVTHSPLAFMYRLFVPTVTINGKQERRPWGVHSFELPPGDYDISVSYPWLFSPECGKNSVRFTLRAGETRRIAYRAGLIQHRPGKMTVS